MAGGSAASDKVPARRWVIRFPLGLNSIGVMPSIESAGCQRWYRCGLSAIEGVEVVPSMEFGGDVLAAGCSWVLRRKRGSRGAAGFSPEAGKRLTPKNSLATRRSLVRLATRARRLRWVLFSQRAYAVRSVGHVYRVTKRRDAGEGVV
jgi:hypothetical protein